MMKKIFFILTIFIFICRTSLAADCGAIEINPQIKLSSSYGKLTFDETKSAEEITALAQKFNIVENGLFAAGLSTVNINFDISINTTSIPVGNSEFCVIPAIVDIFLGLNEPTIYISKELKKNSCQYNLVMRHEKIHQQINKTTLEYYLPLFKSAIVKIIKEIKPVNIDDIKKAESSTGELTVIYNKKLTPLVNYIKKEMLTEQQKLDNMQNYSYENSLCP